MITLRDYIEKVNDYNRRISAINADRNAPVDGAVGLIAARNRYLDIYRDDIIYLLAVRAVMP